MCGKTIKEAAMWAQSHIAALLSCIAAGDFIDF